MPEAHRADFAARAARTARVRRCRTLAAPDASIVTESRLGLERDRK